MDIETRAVGLRPMRETRRLTRQQLADRLGMSVRTVESLESGVERPSRELRRVLMAYFDCSFEDLFEVVSVNPDQAND
jgi:DNA-binding XRE family transcriptional regulator